MPTAERVDLSTYLTPGEVAELFGVTPKTISRWDHAGILRAERTRGGHRRFEPEAVRALLERQVGVGEP